MPWTAKQLKLFRAAAHNPAIAKSSGIKQADAERMSKEGLKKMSGGGKAVINKQDTRHGKLDMPFNKLNRFAGMKAGGMMKKGRKFNTGDRVYAEDAGITGRGDEKVEDQYRDSTGEGADTYAEPQKSTKLSDKKTEGPQKKQSFSEAFKDARTSGDSTFMWNGKKYSTEMAKPAARSGPSRSEMAEMARAPAVERVAAGREVPPVEPSAARATARGQLGRLAKKSADTSDEQKQEVTDRLATLASVTPAGRGVQAAFRGARALGAGTKGARGAMEKAAEGTASRYRGETNPRGWENMTLAERAKASGGYKKGGSIKRFAAGGMTKGIDKKLPTSKQMGALGMKSGGMKESKAMVGKEVAFMKKKGAPKSMIKHEEAEMKYARGGGIESKGKTKGTMIKMATGGVVKFARGGGIESKGKTKGTLIKMKGC